MRGPVGALVALILAAAACGTPGDNLEGSWAIHHRVADGAILSVWGSTPDDVWAAGGSVDRGIVLHSDGEGWTEVDTGATSMLWWVYGFAPDDVYAVGERGLILHFDGASWQRAESGTDLALYGVWGASGGDVWIVGGDPTQAGSAVLLRGQGTSFSPVALPDELRPSVFFKAYGYSESDIILVGTGGTVLRGDGVSWQRDPIPTREPIFSLWGRGRDDLYAVGGWASGTVLHFGGEGWTEVAAAAGSGLTGVFTGPDSPTIAVGSSAYVLEILPDGSEIEPAVPELSPSISLHGVWGDDAGTTYAVGGDMFTADGPADGVIVRRR